jgi:hypothetical protein
MMNSNVTSISVGDQEQALRLSTDTPSQGRRKWTSHRVRTAGSPSPHPRSRTASSVSLAPNDNSAAGHGSSAP